MAQFDHCEMSNGCEVFHYIKWEHNVQEPEGNELLSWEILFIQEFYMQDNLTVFLWGRWQNFRT